MKRIALLLGSGLCLLFTSCASRHMEVVAGPVGPSPSESKTHDAMGRLEVFSETTPSREYQDNGNPSVEIQRHTPYYIYNTAGTMIAQVGNSSAHYPDLPEAYPLRVGHYVVRAQCTGDQWVAISVKIGPGQTTQVHLDGNWTLPVATPTQDIIVLPNGMVVGWRASQATGRS